MERKEFCMTQEEMDEIIRLNKEGPFPCIQIADIDMGQSMQSIINDYWEGLGKKYGFIPRTVTGPGSTKLHFLALPTKGVS